MQLGMIGLGRMGGNIVRRLLRTGHGCVVYDRNPERVWHLADEGASAAASLKDMIARSDRATSGSCFRRERSRKQPSGSFPTCSSRATSLSMAAIRFTRMTSAGRANLRRKD